jgi:hypothetical protein
VTISGGQPGRSADDYDHRVFRPDLDDPARLGTGVRVAGAGFLLSIFGIVTPQFLWKNIRYAILIIAIVAAIITPTPDAMTMLIFMARCWRFILGYRRVRDGWCGKRARTSPPKRAGARLNEIGCVRISSRWCAPVLGAAIVRRGAVRANQKQRSGAEEDADS